MDNQIKIVHQARGGSMEPNDKDLAEFALRGLAFRLLMPTAVVAWADAMIEQSDAPAAWVIDLAMANPDAVQDVLKRVPGEGQGGLSLDLFLALLFRRWNSGRLAIKDVLSIGWRLHCDSVLPAPKGCGDWGVVICCEADEVNEGLRTEDELRNSIHEKLAEYSSVESMLPDWAE